MGKDECCIYLIDFRMYKRYLPGRALLGCLLIMLLSNCNRMDKDLLVIGHRGAMGHETENSLASVQKALDFEVDMIEIDVFRIESGEIVVFHDDRVERLTNGGGRIEEYNIVDLAQLRLDGRGSSCLAPRQQCPC